MRKKSGWFGDTKGHAAAGKNGGLTTAHLYGEGFYSKIGRKGGRVSPGNFKNDPDRAKAAGSRGGKSKGNARKA